MASQQGEPACRGEVVYLYAFDVAYDMTREPIARLLGQEVGEYAIGPSKRSPRQLLFYRPQMISLPPQRRSLPAGPVDVRRDVKVFRIGAISVQIRVPFAVDRFEDLVDYHDLEFAEGGVGEEARRLAAEALEELRPYCIRPVEQLAEGEVYTVFCFDSLPAMGLPGRPEAEHWLQEHRRKLAGLLTQEPDAEALSQQEAVESTRPYVSYYDRDLIVPDWDAALVVAEDRTLDDVLYIMELANVQLVELTAYDRLLDGALQVAYRDVARRAGRARGQVHRGLRELRVDLARFGDELLNVTKYFGDWHLARVYQTVSKRFHLADWHRVIGEKLKTLDDLYRLLQQDRMNLWMLVLEATIVLLFIIDVILLLVGVT